MTRTTTDVLQTKLTVDGKEYSAGLKSAGGSLDKYERKTSKSLDHLRKNWIKYTAVATAALVVFRKLVKLGAEQELVERRLAFAVKSAGLEVASTTQHLQKYASALQKQSVFGDEAIISIQTMMIQLGELSGVELDRATRLTLDFASALGIDIKAAGILMAKAATGSTEALSRYGIVLDTNIPKSEKFAVLLDVMQKKFGGTAEAETGTLSGAISQATNAFGDLGEELGRMNSGVLKTAIKFWGQLAGRMADALATARETSNMSLKQAAALKIQRLEQQLLGKEIGDEMGFMTTTVLPTEKERLRILTEITKQRRIIASQGMLFIEPPPAGDGGAGPEGRSQAEIRQSVRMALFASGLAKETELENQRIEDLRARLELENSLRDQQMQQRFASDRAQSEARKALFESELAHARMMEEAKSKLAMQGLQIGMNLFLQGKNLAIGKAVVATYQGAAQALRDVPYPYNIVAAASVVSAGFAQIRQIKSASASGGGGGSTITTPAAFPTGGNEAAQDISLNIIGAGDLINKEALGQMFFDSLGDMISATGGRTGNVTVNFVEN